MNLHKLCWMLPNSTFDVLICSSHISGYEYHIWRSLFTGQLKGLTSLALRAALRAAPHCAPSVPPSPIPTSRTNPSSPEDGSGGCSKSVYCTVHVLLEKRSCIHCCLDFTRFQISFLPNSHGIVLAQKIITGGQCILQKRLEKLEKRKILPTLAEIEWIRAREHK